MTHHWRETLVYVASEDNIQLAGMVISPVDHATRHMSIVWIHGNAASFYDRPYVLIGRELASHGFTVVLGNTRGHDIAATLWKGDDHSPMAGGGGSGWERMEDAPRDLAAWVDLAAERESGAVLLAGHSKGAQKVILYAAERPSPRLGGVALISPDLYGLRIPGELEAARTLVAEGRGMEVLPAQPWAPWYRQSAQTVVSRMAVAERLLTAETGASAIASIAVPLLATFGSGESRAADDFAAIRENATAVPHITTETIAGANHFYDEHEAALAHVIIQWAGSC